MLDFVNTYIFGPGLCVAVFVFGVFLLLYLRGFFVIKWKKTISALRGGTTDGMSPLKAMILALAGTLGVGNIAGVASAIAIGGAGAIFWMLVSVMAALPIKYAEILLAVRHRRLARDGSSHGGAYFYMADRGTRLSGVLSVLFAVLCIAASFTMGCTVQANAIAVSMEKSFGVSPVFVGLVLALITLFSASGGLKRISFVTGKLIPLMSGIYIAMSLFIILTNLDMVGNIAVAIVSEAFDASSLSGGIVGFITSKALRIGVTRGIVSNEAGCGTAPIAHACATVKSPAAQGVWGMVEVFIDTAVICTLTAFSVLIAERHGVSICTDGMATAVASYGRFIPFAGPIMAAAVLVFAFCTIVCWFFYGTESLAYIVGQKRIRVYGAMYLCIYSLCALVGATVSAEWLWSVSDLVISVMTALNIAVLMLSAGEIKKETDTYFFEKTKNKRQRKFK